MGRRGPQESGYDREKLRKHGEEVGEPLLTPVELATAADPEHTALLLDSRIEDYLRICGR